ncbi:MAG: hypothetical protein IK064_04090 [Clostridia bacterium]|nr:hypothetical protein [Clostridia bacterium]
MFAAPLAIITVGVILTAVMSLIRDYREGGQLIFLLWALIAAGFACIPCSVIALILNKTVGDKRTSFFAVTQLIIGLIFIIICFDPLRDSIRYRLMSGK